MLSELDCKRLRWGCRRGMLELDLLLLPFFESAFSELDDPMKEAFQDLLTAEDTDLYAWLMGHQAAPEQHREILAVMQSWRASDRA